MPTSQLKLIAIHEASHAVVGHVLGMRITGVTIKPDGDTVGKCLADKSDGSLRSAVWAASGPAGEFLFLKSVGESQDMSGSARDWQSLENAIAEVLPEVKGAISRGELMQHPAAIAAMEDAAELVVQYGDEIEHIANYLITRKTLHRDDIQTLLNTGRLGSTVSSPEPERIAARDRSDKPVSPMRGGMASLFGVPIGHAFMDDLMVRHGLDKIPTFDERKAILNEHNMLNRTPASRAAACMRTPTGMTARSRQNREAARQQWLEG